MAINENILKLIGNTPLVKINKLNKNNAVVRWKLVFSFAGIFMGSHCDVFAISNEVTIAGKIPLRVKSMGALDINCGHKTGKNGPRRIERHRPGAD